MNGLISVLIRHALSWGTRRGVDHLIRRGGADGKPMSPHRARVTRTTVSRLRQAVRLLRRIGR